LRTELKLTKEQFTEAGFIFEKANGNYHSDFEKKIISESEFTKLNPSELEQLIVDGLNSGIYKNEGERVSGYWSLSKIGNPNLISEFKKWLQIELNNGNGIAIFQLLVALDRLNEPVFDESRTGRGEDETELNLIDAQNYLNR